MGRADKLIPTIFFLTFVLIQAFFTKYAGSLGLSPIALTIPSINLKIPIIWLVFIGVILQAAVIFNHSIRQPLERMRTLTPEAKYKASTLVMLILFLYTLFLFTPFIVSSPYSIEAMSSLATENPQLRPNIYSLIDSTQPFIELPPVLKYFSTQAAASTILFLVSLIIGGKRKRV